MYVSANMRRARSFHDDTSLLVHAFQVDSGVSHQPMSDAETMEGAVQRARNALREDPEASYAVGLEGGAQKVGERWFECGWIAVVDRAVGVRVSRVCACVR